MDMKRFLLTYDKQVISIPNICYIKYLNKKELKSNRNNAEIVWYHVLFKSCIHND